MKSLILSYGRLTRAPFMVRALVGLLTFAAAVLIEVFLDVVWAHFHVKSVIADRFVQAIIAPIVGLLIAPMLSFLAPFFGGEQSVRSRQSWQDDHFNQWNTGDNLDLYRIGDLHFDPEYSWFAGNIYHGDS